MRFAALLSLLALAACDTTSAIFPPQSGIAVGDVELAADRDAYRAGQEITLTLSNGSASRVETGVMGCATLEKQTSEGWSQDVPYNDRACILPIVVVEPGETFSGTLVLDPVDEGTYRFRHGTNVGELATASFVVTG